MASVGELKDQLKRVYEERGDVEKKIAGHLEALPDVEGPLVDAQGFPRADLDITAVRHHRQQLTSKLQTLEACEVAPRGGDREPSHSAWTGRSRQEI